MRLICPSCAAVHSADAWKSDADARQCLRMVTELPESVSRRCLQYIAFFRPGSGRALRWAKALRLLSEVKDLVDAPHVQWDRNPARPNSARAWGLAMERMIERPPRRLPLTSHGYLRKIAWEIADELDRGTERRQIRDEHAGKRKDAEKRTGQPERLDKGEILKMVQDAKRKARKGKAN